MFLTVPPTAAAGSVDAGGALTSGIRLTFTFPDAQGRTAATYGVVVGSSEDPMAPATIHLNTIRPCPFVNTSVRFLNRFDILYDADGGYFAYRPHP